MMKNIEIKYCSRESFIKKVELNKTILEIGPFFNPVCKGKNVKYFDILSQKEMIQRATQIGQDDKVCNIPYIDFISKSGDLSVVNKKFDAIVSSHVVEHQLDFVEHLKMASNLLKENGKYYLMVPDKRYCFDYYNHKSTIADIINATYEKKERHSIKSLIEHRVFLTHNDSQKHWNGYHGDIYNDIEKIKAAIVEYETGSYSDVHAWYFTDHSFLNIIQILEKLNMIDLLITELYPTSIGSIEFFAVLKKKA